MKVVILAGGLGTRLSEETALRPKPMVEIGGQPILWHIMKHYAHHGFSEFICALGYKGEVIKRYFLDYPTPSGGITIDSPRGAAAAPSIARAGRSSNTARGSRTGRFTWWMRARRPSPAAGSSGWSRG